MTRYNRAVRRITEVTVIIGGASMMLCILDGLGITHLGMRALLGL